MSALKYSHSFDPSPYYKRLYRLAHRAQVSIAAFDVVQVSGFSCEATLMRDNNLNRMSRCVPNVQPRQKTGKRRRRL